MPVYEAKGGIWINEAFSLISFVYDLRCLYCIVFNWLRGFKIGVPWNLSYSYLDAMLVINKVDAEKHYDLADITQGVVH